MMLFTLQRTVQGMQEHQFSSKSKKGKKSLNENSTHPVLILLIFPSLMSNIHTYQAWKTYMLSAELCLGLPKTLVLLPQPNIFIAKLNYMRRYLNRKFSHFPVFYNMYVQAVIDTLLLKLEIALQHEYFPPISQLRKEHCWLLLYFSAVHYF